MSEITLVTAFFDIGRKEYVSIPRSNDKYFEYFKFWSRIKNNLIVYTDSESKDRVIQIRKEFNLEHKTHVIVVDDIFGIEPTMLKEMEEVASNRNFIDFRFYAKATSNTAKYDYLMLFKSWFLADAVRRNLTSETVAWIDFGFNHGGKVYTKPEEFEFTWEYEFNDKIQLFYLDEYDEKPIFEIVKRLNDCVMGPLIVLPATLCQEFWSLNKESMSILNSVGLIDDDQLIMMFSYRRRPEIFDLHRSSWFLGLKEFGASHLTTKDPHEIGRIKRMLLRALGSYLNEKNILKYLLRTYRSLKTAK